MALSPATSHGSTSLSYAKLTDTKASGTNGGASVANAWTQRTINTTDSDASGIVNSLAANQFTLGSGTYLFEILVPMYASGKTKARLQNVTDATTALLGVSCWTTLGNSTAQNVPVIGAVTIVGAKTFEVDYYCLLVEPADGLGVAMALASISEVYTTVSILKIA